MLQCVDVQPATRCSAGLRVSAIAVWCRVLPTRLGHRSGQRKDCCSRYFHVYGSALMHLLYFYSLPNACQTALGRKLDICWLLLCIPADSAIQLPYKCCSVILVAPVQDRSVHPDDGLRRPIVVVEPYSLHCGAAVSTKRYSCMYLPPAASYSSYCKAT
eukprot:GHUV01025901.1.p1 GENE.GHUV01025901.1~~GHUV01025901.1.p1  ORF type:complete len:159 (-),score=2.93 GHUV01025901.1:521-997(-)